LVVSYPALAIVLPAVKIADRKEIGMLSSKYAQPLIYQENKRTFLSNKYKWMMAWRRVYIELLKPSVSLISSQASTPLNPP